MNEVTTFEQQHLILMGNIAVLEKTTKEAKTTLDDLKSKLLTAMQEHDVKSIDNDLMKITRTAASESTSVDLKTFQKEEPVEYAQLLEDYPKVTKRKESIRITVK